MTKNKSEIREFMRDRIGELNDDTPHSRASLAKLRRGIGRSLDESPELFGEVFPGFPLPGNAYAENAVFIALSLYAFHKQGQDSSMNIEKMSIGKAMRGLVRGEDNEEAINSRFDRILTSNNIEELAVHLRGVIGLLKREGVGFDYSFFASDLYYFQQEDKRRKVIGDWGRDYYWFEKEKKEEEEEK
jgi:CRISPR system Cascade subunit CasB